MNKQKVHNMLNQAKGLLEQARDTIPEKRSEHIEYSARIQNLIHTVRKLEAHINQQDHGDFMQPIEPDSPSLF